MKNKLAYGTCLMMLVISFSSCSSIFNNSEISSTQGVNQENSVGMVSSTNINVESSASPVLPEKADEEIVELTQHVLLNSFNNIDQIYLDEKNSMLITLQRIGNEKSAITLFDIVKGETLKHQIYDEYIAKIKIYDNGLMLFSEPDKITKVNWDFEEEYSFFLPEEAKSIRLADISTDEKRFAYIDESQQNIILDTLPPSSPIAVKSAKEIDSGGFMNVLALDDNLFFTSYSTPEYPFGFALFDNTGFNKVNMRNYAYLPQTYDGGLFMHQSMELAYDNQLYIYDLSALDESPKTIKVNDKMEAINAAISKNGKYILTLKEEEKQNKITLTIYHAATGEFKNISVDKSLFTEPITIISNDDSLIINNEGTTGYFLVLSNSRVKLYRVNIL